MTRLSEILTAAAKGRGAASLAVVERAGAEPQASWVPGTGSEPAFLGFSISKIFTAVVILGLCEAGRLTLDDRLARWFPRIPSAGRISLRRLLNHTSGIPDYGHSARYHDELARSPATPWTFDRFAAETFEQGLLFDPGRGWAYSNPGYMLLKRIAEEVTGVPYRSLVAERITRPLGLRRTFVAQSIEDLAPLAGGITSVLSPDRAPRDVRAHYHPGWVSHGVVASTASEVTRFLDGLFRGALLSRDALADMMEWVAVPRELAENPAEPEAGPRRGKPSYGLGLMGDPASPWGLIAGHNGGGPCYGASAFHAFDLGGASVCVMGAIEEGFNPEGVVFDVLDRLAARRDAPAAPGH